MKKSYTDGFFNINSEYGFLPVKEPLVKLPQKYFKLQNIIDNLPNTLTLNNLNKQTILYLIHEFLDDYTDEVNKENDIFIIQALYRAYSFITSGFLLEPAYIEYTLSKKYGKARKILPKKIAVPYTILANKLGVFPWLDYAYSYSLGNYVKINKEGDLHWKNLKMACKFTNTEDETGFIMMHVYINEKSKDLISSIYNCIEGIKNNNISLVNSSLETNYKTMIEMNKRKKEMWEASNPKKYDDFRIFIMGSKGNDEIFEQGVIYEGVNEEFQKYCGQSGSQDSIIPTQDIFSGVINYYPENELTQQLIEFRKYRPKCVQDFLKDLETEMKQNNLFNFAKYQGNNLTLILLLGIVKEIYNFRFGHWNYVKKYIMENTKYPKATGGTEIIKWLPNQMNACKDYYNKIFENIIQDNLSDLEKNLIKEMLF